jgi:hypothetical protein
MFLSKEQDPIFQVAVLFIEKKLLLLWFHLRNRFLNVLDVEFEGMYLNLSKRSKNVIFEMQ